jgi:Ankyrin repeats (3 copies)
MLAFTTFQAELNTPIEEEVYNAVLRWALLATFYHSIVVLCAWGGVRDLFSNGPCWFKIRMHHRPVTLCRSENNDRCRVARFFKCHKRRRRRALSSNYECSMERFFLKSDMPPPLPFCRRRRAYCESDSTSHDATTFEETSPIVNDALLLGDLSVIPEPSHDTDIYHDSISDLSASSLPSLVDSTRSESSHDSSETLVVSPRAKSKKTKHKGQKSKRQSKRSSTVPTVVQTSLIDLARMQHWSAVVARASTDTIAAQHQDADGLLPLHWACSGGPPVEVIQGLLNAFPEGTGVVDGDGSTALHFAAHYGGSVAVVETLLNNFPRAVSMLDKYGRSPLYHAVDKSASLEVLDTLIRADASMVTAPCLPNVTNLAQILRTQDNQSIEHRTPLYLSWTMAMSDRQTRSKKSGRLWEKAQLLLRAAYINRETQTIYRMVHAAVAFDSYLPKDVILFAIELFPALLKEKDEVSGQLPLAIAAGSRQRSSQRSQELLQLLIRCFPQAARVSDFAGRYPLALALDSGKGWDNGVAMLFQAAPDLIHGRDRVTGLPPALLSASATLHISDKCNTCSDTQTPLAWYLNSKDLEWQRYMMSLSKQTENQPISKNMEQWSKLEQGVQHLSTVFELLRSAPSVLKY